MAKEKFMAKIKGTVGNVGKGKFSYFVVLDEKDGYYFNTKFEPKCGKGDVVGIEYIEKGSNRGNVQKIVVLEANSSGYSEAPAASGKDYPAATGGNRQDSIVWQSSRKDALVAVGIMLQQEAYMLKGKPDAKRIQIDGLIDEITVRYFADASDPMKSKAYTLNAEVTEDVPDEEPEESEAGGADEWETGKGDEWEN